MEAKAIYRQETREDGSTIHAVDHDSGGFLVSSEKVGVAVQNFLNNASVTDIVVLHGHLLVAYHNARVEADKLPVECEVCHGHGLYDDGDGESGPSLKVCDCEAGEQYYNPNV